MNPEDLFIRNRLLELANQCYQREYLTHSDFLGLHEQSVLSSIRNEMPPVCCQLMGGYCFAERKVAVFTPFEDYPVESPFHILRISRESNKAYETLSHRDYLGSVMGLGIKRELLGDLVRDGDDYYLFALPPMDEYIIHNLTLVRHTAVMAVEIAAQDFSYEPEREPIAATVASIRLDSIIAAGFGSSRNHIITYIEEGKVSVNGQIITTNAYNLHPLDIISVRGLGKIQYMECKGTTKKGRQSILLDKYK